MVYAVVSLTFSVRTQIIFTSFPEKNSARLCFSCDFLILKIIKLRKLTKLREKARRNKCLETRTVYNVQFCEVSGHHSREKKFSIELFSRLKRRARKYMSSRFSVSDTSFSFYLS